MRLFLPCFLLFAPAATMMKVSEDANGPCTECRITSSSSESVPICPLPNPVPNAHFTTPPTLPVAVSHRKLFCQQDDSVPFPSQPENPSTLIWVRPSKREDTCRIRWSGLPSLIGPPSCRSSWKPVGSTQGLLDLCTECLGRGVSNSPLCYIWFKCMDKYNVPCKSIKLFKLFACYKHKI